ncbi:MAG: phosphoglucosamine mutase [Armatimonadota bacterium]|nr:phosphoglucosamine mutase [Armatimonadota bacterium]
MSLFGTDGIRGLANTKLSPDLALRLGRAAGICLAREGGKRAVIGRDTRRSGGMLGAGLAAGFNSAGIETVSLGVVPTPTVSHAVRTTAEFQMGAVISASHNPAADNGIKFLGHDGRKLTDEVEAAIEAEMDSAPTVVGHEVGLLKQDRQPAEVYLQWLAGLLPERLDGFKVAVDCANGAAYELAPRLLRQLGAEIVAIGTDPDGDNINSECGATNPGMIQQLTLEVGASIGVAFDGDADRCVFSDEKGVLINGDRTMGIWAAWHGAPCIVGTVMSNMGFEKSLDDLGIAFERTDVGDKYVARRMQELGAKIGGEQSGHLIFSEWTPTGDGLLTAIQMLRVLRLSGCAASELPPVFENWPQLLVNVALSDKDAWKQAVSLHKYIEDQQQQLDGGRVVVRPSGTQPMIRVMVESQDRAKRDAVADQVVSRVVSELGGHVQGRVDLTDALGD